MSASLRRVRGSAGVVATALVASTLVVASPAAGAPACSSSGNKVVLGTGSVQLDADISGHITSTEVMTTSCGATLTFESGTEMRAARGTALSGPIQVKVKDFTPKHLSGGITPDGGFVVRVELISPTGPNVKVDSATFDPPVPLLLPAVSADGPVFTSYLGALGDNTVWLGKGKPDRLDPYDEVGAEPGLRGETKVEGSRAVLFDRTIPAPLARPAVPAADPPARVDRIPIPPGDSVKYVRLILPGTSQIVGAAVGATGAPGGRDYTIEPGESTTMTQGAFTASVVEEDGQRYLEISSPYAGMGLIVQYRLQSQGIEGSPDHRDTVPGTGGDDESDPDADYYGAVEVTVKGCTSDEFTEFSAAIDTMKAAGLDMERDSLDTGSGSFGRARIFNYADSIQELPARLPPDWEFEFGQRRVVIKLPCPSPVVYAASPAAVFSFDGDLVPLVPPAPLTRPLTGLEPAGGGRLFGVDNGNRLVVFDPETLAGTRTKIVATGVAAHPALPLIFVTSEGKLTAYNEDTLKKKFAVRLPGAYPMSPRVRDQLVLVTDGPLVRVIDINRKQEQPSFGLPGTGPIAVHPNLPLVARSDPASNRVWTVNLTGGPPQPFGTGSTPMAVTWLPVQPVAVVAVFDQDECAFVPAINPPVPVEDGPVICSDPGTGLFVAAKNAGVVETFGPRGPVQVQVPGVEILVFGD